MHDAAVREEVAELEALLATLEELPDGDARTAALAAVQGLLRLYGEALRRITEKLEPVPHAVGMLLEDELVSQLLMLHGLDQASLEERVTQALEEVRPYMGSHGGGIELIELSDGVARVRLEGTCSGCAASTVTLKLAVEEAILRAAPELHAVEAIDGSAPSQPPAPSGQLLPMLDPPVANASPAGSWVAAGEVAQLDGHGPLRRQVGGSSVLFTRAGGELYAYLDRCPACRAPVENPRLDGDALCCGGCGRRYDVRRAGMNFDGGLLQLDPIPLLVSEGQVRLAIGTVAS